MGKYFNHGVADECHNDTTLAKESPQDLDLKENVAESEPTPDIAQAGSISNTQRAQSLQTASKGTSPTAASNGSTSSKGASNAAISPDENVRLDSLQASLKKFCAPELLTGKNRFACIFCSKKKVEETTENEMLQPKSPQVRAATGEVENEVEVSHNEEEERNVSQRVEKESSLETQCSLPAPPNSDNQLGEDTKEGGENAGSEVSSSEDEGDNREEWNEENSHEESNKESDGKAKYEVLVYFTMQKNLFPCPCQVMLWRKCQRRRLLQVKGGRKSVMSYSLRLLSSCSLKDLHWCSTST